MSKIFYVMASTKSKNVPNKGKLALIGYIKAKSNSEAIEKVKSHNELKKGISKDMKLKAFQMLPAETAKSAVKSTIAKLKKHGNSQIVINSFKKAILEGKMIKTKKLKELIKKVINETTSEPSNRKQWRDIENDIYSHLKELDEMMGWYNFTWAIRDDKLINPENGNFTKKGSKLVKKELNNLKKTITKFDNALSKITD